MQELREIKLSTRIGSEIRNKKRGCHLKEKCSHRCHQSTRWKKVFRKLSICLSIYYLTIQLCTNLDLTDYTGHLPCHFSTYCFFYFRSAKGLIYLYSPSFSSSCRYGHMHAYKMRFIYMYIKELQDTSELPETTSFCNIQYTFNLDINS